MIISVSCAEYEHTARVTTERLMQAGAHVTTAAHAGDTLVISDRDVPTSVFEEIRALPAVTGIKRFSGSLRLSTREWKPHRTHVPVGSDVCIGNGDFVVAAGPCAVESADQLHDVATCVARRGASILRGGAFKPRTSPYSFQGLKHQGLDLLAQQRAVTGLPVVTEVVDSDDVAEVAKTADMLQVGTRNMHNYALLQAVGHSGVPVLLKRGFAATVEEWLQASEYILAAGNDQVVLCERGIRSYEPTTRFQLDLGAVAAVRQASHLPVLVDPSHAVGRADLVLPMSLAAAAAGADGLLVDVHTNPDQAKCDAKQALTDPEFAELMGRVQRVAQAVGRERA